MKQYNFIFIAFILTVFSFNGQSQTIYGLAEVEKIFMDRGEVYYKFEKKPELDFEVLTKTISIDSKTNNNWVYAYANKKGTDARSILFA